VVSQVAGNRGRGRVGLSGLPRRDLSAHQGADKCGKQCGAAGLLVRRRRVLAGRGAPDSVNVTDVIATPGGFLAVGVGRDGTAAWRSADGHTWVVAPVTAGDGGGRHALWGVHSFS
jgi:hypothetical protein